MSSSKASTRTMRCEAGNHDWERPVVRGRLPRNCPDHQESATRGFIQWEPQPETRALLTQVYAVLAQYKNYLPMTSRQIFYALVGGYGYSKTEASYGRLTTVLTKARRSRLIPFSSIRDDKITGGHAPWYSGVDDFMDQARDDAARYQLDAQDGFPLAIELWTEAAGMVPQLRRVADKFSVPVYSASGFLSVTATYEIGQRAIRAGKPTLIAHMGDYDPSGESIFAALSEDATAFAAEGGAEIMSARWALTENQVTSLNLPTAPPKSTDTRTRNWTGTGTVQLEALAPDDLTNYVEGRLRSIFDKVDGGWLEAIAADEADHKADLLQRLAA